MKLVIKKHCFIVLQIRRTLSCSQERAVMYWPRTGCSWTISEPSSWNVSITLPVTGKAYSLRSFFQLCLSPLPWPWPSRPQRMRIYLPWNWAHHSISTWPNQRAIIYHSLMSIKVLGHWSTYVMLHLTIWLGLFIYLQVYIHFTFIYGYPRHPQNCVFWPPTFHVDPPPPVGQADLISVTEGFHVPSLEKPREDPVLSVRKNKFLLFIWYVEMTWGILKVLTWLFSCELESHKWIISMSVRHKEVTFIVNFYIRLVCCLEPFVLSHFDCQIEADLFCVLSSRCGSNLCSEISIQQFSGCRHLQELESVRPHAVVSVKILWGRVWESVCSRNTAGELCSTGGSDPGWWSGGYWQRRQG